MKVVVVDGQGGRLGKLLVESIVQDNLACQLLVVGTNSIATSAMLKGGATQGATGENPLLVACRDADVIVGPIGILSADSMLGEITPNMAMAVGQSRAKKLLLPVNLCSNIVVGVRTYNINELVSEALKQLRELCE
ncbi:MAG: DUF3842 family protein [Eubacteriales bacterium]|nr:DUF3842 family protein [Eubacteriales bacterium]